MIWARPLSSADAAGPLWKRSGLTPEGVGLVRSGLESHALVTGLDEAHRELLAELVGAAWAGGSGDAAIVRYSRLAVESWFARMGLSELGVALSRLLLLDAMAMEWSSIRIQRNPACPVCGGRHAGTVE